MCYNIVTMNVEYKNNNIILTNVQDFDLAHIFDCGQCFRFNKISDNIYFGIAFGHALKIEQTDSSVILYDTSPEEFENTWFDFFDFGTDYGKIKHILSENDAIMKEAVKYGSGIRILHQELWETVISFIISQSNNIPRIKGIIERLCENFGEQILFEGNIYYSFPGPEKIGSLSLEDLSVIRAGFRDKYILAAADAFNSGTLSDSLLKSVSTADAKKALVSVKGIGNKVSDCILLFGLGRVDSFPVDVWIKRIMEYCYFDEEQTIPVISRFAAEKFGSLGGYAQQYLFFYARENKIGN